jgi:tRNA-specific 2-thiouridylase
MDRDHQTDGSAGYDARPGAGVRALGLLSGGLDSSLAVRILQAQGIEVVGLHFYTGFCFTHSRRKASAAGGGDACEIPMDAATEAGARLGVRVAKVDISREYLPILTRPRYGYGSAINPCIDCRIAMLRKARALLAGENARFIFTGEVVGQRPMTQMRNTLRLIEKQSGCEGILLRPLSARLLPETLPEREGWVDRERLYGVSGRGRKVQMELAEAFGLKDYPQPAGGCCVLTDRNYARRLKDLFRYRSEITLEDAYLLKFGRHFRISEGLKVIVGRDEGENQLLGCRKAGFYHFTVKDFPGPTVLAEFNHEPALSELRTVASLAVRYSDGKHERQVAVRCGGDDAGSTELVVDAASDEMVGRWRI